VPVARREGDLGRARSADSGAAELRDELARRSSPRKRHLHGRWHDVLLLELEAELDEESAALVEGELAVEVVVAARGEEGVQERLSVRLDRVVRREEGQLVLGAAASKAGCRRLRELKVSNRERPPPS